MNINSKCKDIKPYKIQNMIFKQETPPAQHQAVGYLSVSVFTASGALPVPDAVVTVYDIHENGEEHVFYHRVTDKNGSVPKMTLPVAHEGREYEFAKYNLRVQAIGYYTINIFDFSIFPDITTYFRIELIPTARGVPEEEGQTVIIPPTPLDITN